MEDEGKVFSRNANMQILGCHRVIKIKSKFDPELPGIRSQKKNVIIHKIFTAQSKSTDIPCGKILHSISFSKEYFE